MDERTTQRVVTDLQTEVRIGERAFVMHVYDLSQGGCMVEVPDAGLRTGDIVRLELGPSEHCGTVVWKHLGYAGVEFFHQLPLELVTFLGFRPSKIPFEAYQPRDRFGRPLPALSTPTKAAI